jgi:hypothetical protein
LGVSCVRAMLCGWFSASGGMASMYRNHDLPLHSLRRVGRSCGPPLTGVHWRGALSQVGYNVMTTAQGMYAAMLGIKATGQSWSSHAFSKWE